MSSISLESHDRCTHGKRVRSPGPVFIADTTLKVLSSVGILESSDLTWMGLERNHPRGRSQHEKLLTGFFLRGPQILQSWR